MEGKERWLVVTTEEYYPGVGVFDSKEEAEEAYAEIIEDFEEQAHYLRTKSEPRSEQDLINTQDLARNKDKTQIYIAKVTDSRL